MHKKSSTPANICYVRILCRYNYFIMNIWKFIRHCDVIFCLWMWTDLKIVVCGGLAHQIRLIVHVQVSIHTSLVHVQGYSDQFIARCQENSQRMLFTL